MTERTVSGISADDLVRRAIKNARPHCVTAVPRWVAIKDVFALGRTFSQQLCALHGVDPDELIPGIGNEHDEDN